MAKNFKQWTRKEFAHAINTYPWRRKITQVHMHHTWQPNHSQWKGRASQVGMWRFHTKTRGWSDIAQHLTIAPDGTLWEGRNWNKAPASSNHFNGNRKRGPFMFETVGNFDKNKDSLEGEQLESVLFVIAFLQDKFNLPVSSLKFHRHLRSPKTCPGSAVDYDAICDMVKDLKVKKNITENSSGSLVSRVWDWW